MKALGGAPLAGDGVVRLIYLDEAGISNPLHEPFMLVAGAIVHADRQAKHLEAELRRIREKHCPDAPKGFVFHATSIFSGESGNRYFARDRWPKEKRWAILDDLVKIPAAFDVPIATAAIDRRERRTPTLAAITDARELQNAIHRMAVTMCMIRADWWMRQNAGRREVALLIAEDNPDVRKALREMQGFGREPDKTEGLLPGWDRYLPFRRIVDTLHYAAKGESPLLQLADVAAFVVKRALMSTERPVSEGKRFFDPLRRQVYEPALKLVGESRS